MSTAEIVDQLQQAANGLLYPSESDAPFVVLVWPPAPGSAMEQVKAAAPNEPVEHVRIGQFFGELATADDAQRFQKLRELIERLLIDPGVFRVGAGPEIGIYIVGRATGGEWVVLGTTSVET